LRSADSYQDTSLADFIGILRRRKSLFLLTAVLVPLVTALASLAQTRVYEASAQVLLLGEGLAEVVNGLPGSSLSGDADRMAQTQVDIARVDTVAAKTLRALRLGDRSANDLLANSRVSAKGDADVLVFTVADTQRLLAIRLANEYAHQFTVYRAQLDLAPVTRALGEVRSKISDLEARNGNAELIEGLRIKMRQLETLEAVQFSTARVLHRASDAPQVRPRLVFNVFFAFIIGIALGAAVAFVIDATDTRVRSVKEVLEAIDMPVLGLVPELPSGPALTERLVMLNELDSSAAEAFRMLRTKLDLANLTHRAQVIMFTSALENDGKSTVISNLSVALARGGRNVVLVDFDLRRSSLMELFSLRSHRGLTTVALDAGTMEEALLRIDLSRDSMGQEMKTAISRSGAKTAGSSRVGATIPGVVQHAAHPVTDAPGPAFDPRVSATTGRHGELRILPAGPTPANVGEFVETSAVRKIFDDLRTRSDFVLVDAPPLSVSDAISLATVVDAIVIVTSLRTARRPVLFALQQTLATLPAAKLGLVITDVDLDEDLYGAHAPYSEGEVPPVPLRVADKLETTAAEEEVRVPQSRWGRQG